MAQPKPACCTCSYACDNSAIEKNFWRGKLECLRKNLPPSPLVYFGRTNIIFKKVNNVSMESNLQRNIVYLHAFRPECCCVLGVYVLVHWDAYCFVFRFLLQFCLPKGAEFSQAHSKTHLDINSRNTMGATPLELAVYHGHKAVVKVLLDFGAASGLPDSLGRPLSSPFYGIQFLLDSRITG